MEPAQSLLVLFEPVSWALMVTATLVTCFAAIRSLNYAKDKERTLEFSSSTVTIDHSHALLLPITSSCGLLLAFYLFTSMSILFTVIAIVSSVYSLYFCLAPYVSYIKSRLGLADPVVSRCCSKSFTRSRGILVIFSAATVLVWLVSGHWLLNNILGIAICVSFVCHVRLPNVKVCTVLLSCLFLYDVFWVYYSENVFGENVMVSVAMKQASNPVHKVASSLSLPGQDTIIKNLDLPTKLIFPRDLFGGFASKTGSEYMMLGLGDMTMPSMFLALLLYHDTRKRRDSMISTDLSLMKRWKYIWIAAIGYVIGLVAAFVVGVLTRDPQPALFFLVPTTLGPVLFIAWTRKELAELWNGPRPSLSQRLEKIVEERRRARTRGGNGEGGSQAAEAQEMGPPEMKPHLMGSPEGVPLVVMGSDEAGPSEIRPYEMEISEAEVRSGHFDHSNGVLANDRDFRIGRPCRSGGGQIELQQGRSGDSVEPHFGHYDNSVLLDDVGDCLSCTTQTPDCSSSG
ncbi:hypothetical protein H6P81_017124 [Aristolochia fimbriata]|uniref:Signal peptide peptidase-like 3 n=1 Tax=Aristolochia fimbriata TaxID=158543 RepID=A0AAV7DXA1_ARIFI|nr:hypothetical protein H6P81_017124 [Aristolochia fimbriata]